MNIRKEIFAKLKTISTKKFDEDTLIEEIGVDSLDLVSLVVEAEDTYKIKVPDEELTGIEKVKDILDLIESKVK